MTPKLTQQQAVDLDRNHLSNILGGKTPAALVISEGASKKRRRWGLKDIPGYEGYYAVTPNGKVWSRRRNGRRTGKWIKYRLHSTGYLVVRLCKNGQGKSIRIHRLVAMTYIEQVSGKPDINHKDGNKLNNRISNLEWCNITENRNHAYRTGLQHAPKGEDHWSRKLSEKDVVEIRNRYVPYKVTLAFLAKEYGVCAEVIRDVVNRKAWRHVV